MQTPIYQYISNIKPNVSNLDAMFLELYQHDHLNALVPYFTNHCGEVVNRIHNAMKIISGEILNIYHNTRSHKNEKLYDSLPGSYKTALYAIHGKYLQKHKRELEKKDKSELGDSKSIMVYDIYDSLKHLEPYCLRQMFVDRLSLMNKDDMAPFIKHNGFDAMLQGKLMA